MSKETEALKKAGKDAAKETGVMTFRTTQEVNQGLQADSDTTTMYALRAMRDLPEDNFMEISSSYFKPEKGVIYNAICTGISVQQFPDKNNAGETKDVECIHLTMEENGKLVNKIFGGKQMVGAVRDEINSDKAKGLPEQYIGLRFFQSGESKSAKGTYAIFDIRENYFKNKVKR